MAKNSHINNISIIATVLNDKKTISTFIDSLLNQHFKANEIIIVDGGSIDGTAEILKEYDSCGKIKLITKKCNIAEGRNIAISNATNELIAVSDSGCDVDEFWLDEINQAFLSPKKPDIIAGNYKFNCLTTFEEVVVLATSDPDRESSDAAIYYPSSRSLAFKKTAWQIAKGYPEWLYAAEDTLFNIRLRQLGFKFIFAPKAIVKWRPRENYRALTKQQFNYARGNGRVGIGTRGYYINLYYHFIIFMSLILLPFSILFIIPASIYSYRHIKNNLWSQAKKATLYSSIKNVTYQVLIIMEHSRLVGMLGFIAGRWDRVSNKKFISSLYSWMGSKSLDKFNI